MKIAVFCSANSNIAPIYFERTAELGRYMALHGHELVFGGCNMGLMECIARSVSENGGHSIGVIPSKIEEHGAISKYVCDRRFVSNLSQRKDLMLELADIVVALPGGIGTLDEVFTVAAAATIGYHSKKIVLYNIDGFWNKLYDTLLHLQESGFIRGKLTDYIILTDKLEDIFTLA